jgi:hypothetical protein
MCHLQQIITKGGKNMKIKRINQAENSRTMYMTSISKYLRYPYSNPSSSIEKSIISAENMICSALLNEANIDWSGLTYFTQDLRRYYPEFVEKAQQYIGETIEVDVPIDVTAKQYRIWFCSVTYDQTEESE